MRRPVFSLVLILLAGFLLAVQAQVDPELLAGMKARSIGPAGMSGRIASIEAVDSNPDIIYVGTATGGVWKSESGGITWTPIFDDQPVAAIGAVAVYQPNPDIVWVGTGEGNMRNSVSVGNGIYKSLDAGKTWTHLGLKETEHIARVVLDPRSAEVAYVCALGKMWGENPERGVYKTTDGGKTWKKILYVDEKTGCADLTIDPGNPEKLIAALWDYRRWPWFFRSGGPGSGLYITVDGGANWQRRTPEDGLPEGDLGRIGVAFSRSNPEIVYALVEAGKSALLRSEDGGWKWKTVNEEQKTADRPFYYADLRVDPEQPNRVYNLYSRISVSNDGGKSFQVLVPYRGVHPDHHAMWINPKNARHIIEGDDGGVYLSYDRGQSWRFVSNLPVAQYYHIRVDMDTPYHVYGGMQDNGSWRGPSAVWETDGIRNLEWEEVGFGDGFDTAPDPEDSLRGYSMSQEGYLVRWNLRTGERKNIRPAGPEGVKLRFNWNTGFAQDPFDAATIYLGSQFLHKSTDRGETWTLISPDLTTNNPEWQKQDDSGGLTPDVTGAENFTTIIAIAPSPREPGVIWVGTDDGRVQVTRDAGATWTSVEKNVKGVPANTWVPHIEPSKFDAATAYVVFDNHRRSDWTPYIFKTTDYGQTWSSLATSNLRGYALALVQDPMKEDLLFLGTEFGLYVTLDGGKTWFQWKHGFPTVSAMALVVQPQYNDLVIGTHGRSAYILDDIQPLRVVTAETMAEPIHFFDIPDAQQYQVKQTGESRFPGDGEFRGENKPYGALLTYSLNFPGLPHPKEAEERKRKEAERAAKQKEAGTPESGAEAEGEKKEEEKAPQVEIVVKDPDSDVVREFKQPAVLGVNRAAWDLRRNKYKEPPQPEGESFFRSTPEVLPGTYTVTVKYKDQEASKTVKVLPDPRTLIAWEDRVAKWEAFEHAGALKETVTEAINRIRQTRKDVDTVVAKVKAQQAERATDGKAAPTDAEKQLLKSAGELKKALATMEKRLWQPPETKGIPAENDAMSKLDRLLRFYRSSWDAPTAAEKVYLREAEELVGKILPDFNQLFAEPVAAFRAQVKEMGIELLPEKEPLSLPEED
jgi:photosystem II stability/assembly factor-like uncharacterized protein